MNENEKNNKKHSEFSFLFTFKITNLFSKI